MEKEIKILKYEYIELYLLIDEIINYETQNLIP